MPTVEACARWAVPNASLTYTSAYAASALANSGSLASSSAWKRRFSSSRSSPGRIRLTASSVPTPSASPVTGTLRRMSCVRRAPTGRRRSPSWTLPLGRPRWLARTTWAPWSTSALMVGIEARMRESSVTWPSCNGTLKSTRTKTRLPATSASRMVCLFIGRVSGGHRQPRRDVGDQVGHPAAVAPLVVVPGDHFDHRAADDHRRLAVDDRGSLVALEVHRHERLVRHAEDALEPAVGGIPEGLVQLLDRRLAADLGGEVDDADRRRRHAQAEAVEPALEVRDDEGERLRGTGRGRDDVLARRSRAARVLVRDVEDALVVGVAVDRVHQPALDPEQVVHDLRRGCQAVRGAAGVADDVVGRRVVLLVVDAEDDRDVLVLGRGADDDLLRAGGDVGFCLFRVGEDAGRLDDDVHAEIAPRQGRGVLLLEHLDLESVDEDRVDGIGLE